MKQFNILIKVFFLLLFIFNVIECQITVQDITVKPNIVLYTPCIFRSSYLVSDPTGNPNTLSVTTSGSDFVISKSLSQSNSTACFFYIEVYEAQVGVFNNSFIAKNSLNSNSQEFFVHFECKTLTYQDIQYKNISTRTMELDIFGKISTFVKIESPSYSGFTTHCQGCVFPTNGRFGRIEVSSLLNYKDNQLEAGIVVGGNVTGKISIYPTLYFKSNVYDVISNFKISSNSDTVYLISNILPPLFTFESNLTSYYPYYQQYIYQGAEATYFRYRPISSSDNGNKIKYIGYIDSLATKNEYSISAQKYEEYESFYSNILTFIPISYSPIPIGSITDYTNYFTIEFSFVGTGGGRSYYTPFKITYFDKNYFIPSSFGLNYGKSSDYTFKASIFKEPSAPSYVMLRLTSFDGTDYSGGFTVTPNTITQDNGQPVFQLVETVKLSQHYYLLRIKASHTSPIYKYQINGVNYNTYYLADNPNADLLNPTYELIVNGFDLTIHIVITANELASSTLIVGKYYDIGKLLYFNIPTYNNDDFDYLDISYAKILYRRLDVTNKTAGNILYFNFTQPIDIETPISFVLFNPKSIFQRDTITQQYPTKDMFPAVYNHSINMFQVEFFVKANSHQGKMPYALFLSSDKYIPSNILPDNAQFTIISYNEDIYGPIFKSISKYNDGFVFGWSLEIIDDYNGIESGYFTVRGALDSSIYNFQFVRPSSETLGSTLSLVYNITITLQEPCVVQDYYITNVTLNDKLGYNSTYAQANYINSIEDSLSNPFINFMNDMQIFTQQACTGIVLDSTAPELVDFKVTVSNPFDVGLSSRGINFEIVATDTDTGLKKGQSPTIYLTTSSINILECHSYASIIVDQYSTRFLYQCIVPTGFGYPYGIIFSIGPIINNGGIFKAFSTDELQTLGFRNSIASNEIAMSTSGYPSISGSSRFTVDGGDLWIFGRAFSSVLEIKLQYSNSTQVNLQIDQNHNSAIKIINLPPSELSFNLVLYRQSSLYSDPYIFKPDPKVEIVPVNDSSDSSTSTSEELPSNPNQQCQGNPKCGGPSNGYCSTTGCVCYSPWVGLDCMSKVIIVPQPNTNDTEPSTGIDIGGNDNSSSDEISNIVYKSFISLVSLREVDITGEPLYDYKFEKWTYNKLSNTTHQYKTNITTSTITATLQWFDKSTNITFANQQLIMNPSTIKYTIEIENYPFKSQLNSLELIMSASLESTKTDNICSSQQFGNTSNSDNSNYMKIQVDNHSLYGRFIKRGIFDSNNEIRSISNRLIKSNKTNTEYSSNTLIAIQMNYFTSRASIDPDFSIIINPSSASSKSPNSICSKSGLNASKIAGIVIGSVAFAAVVIISVCYYLIKKRNQQKFISSMQHKLNEMK